MPRILISAGEASGDMHAAAVIRSLSRLMPDAEIHGVAGPAMRAAGCHTLIDMNQLNVMGIGDVVRALPRIRRVADEISAWVESERPDVVILVDFPGFHMRLGERLRRLGIPVLYYIAPKLWAWGKWRVKRLRRAQDRLASILPFEQEWFAPHGIQAEYVGNPSAWECKDGWSRDELKQRLGVPADEPLLALLPGSRPGELARHTELLANAWREIRAHMPGPAHAVVTRAPGVSNVQLQPLIDAGVLLLDRLEPAYALRADAAIAVSGTATLELALWDVPTVLVYRGSPLMIWLARKLVGTDCAGLANILLDDREVMPELIQEYATVERIVAETLPLLQGGDAAVVQRREFARLRELLGGQNPADGVADMCAEMIKKGRS
jgi:lipid-A-disaccharide synthase